MRAVSASMGSFTLRQVQCICMTAGVLIGCIAGCSKGPDAMAGGAVDVKVVEVQPQNTELYTEKVGEVRGSQEVDLRSQATGVLLKKHFQDGALVKQGQLLFSIDAREYRAQLASTQAQLASAEANLARAKQDVDRYAPLLAENAISRQMYDTAVATAKQAQAQVDASRAAISEARLGVEYAEVRAPFTGRIGAAQVFEGSLISAGVTPLAQLSRDDPAWVYFNVSESELLDYQRRLSGAQPTLGSNVRQVTLELSDRSRYPLSGSINFLSPTLDATTGTYGLRAEFPNPDHRLIPGLFARVRAITEKQANAITVPDRAVQQQLGRYFVTVVGADSKAEVRAVTPGPRLGSLWVIDTGLKAGDRVVVEGVQKARAGAPLKATLITASDLESPGQTQAAGG